MTPKTFNSLNILNWKKIFNKICAVVLYPVDPDNDAVGCYKRGHSG